MTKRLFAMMLVLVMVLSMLPTGVLAEGAEQTMAEKHTLYTVQASHDHVANDAHICEHCVAAGKTGDEAKPTWIAWGDDEAEKKVLPTTSGHYYIVGDLEKMTTTKLAAASTVDVVICLNGKNLNCNNAADASNRFYTLEGNNKVTILDCTAHTDADGNYVAGAFNNGTYCSFFYTNAATNKAVLTIYDGIINNSTRRNANATAKQAGGAICVQGPGTVNIYGGMIQNCSASSGGAIYFYSKGATLNMDGGILKNNYATGNSSGDPAYGTSICFSSSGTGSGTNTANITGGVITGNTSTRSGADCCGAFFFSTTTKVNLGGNVQIIGNTDKDGNANNLYLTNAAGNQPKLNINGLDSDAKVGILVKSERVTADDGLVLSTELNDTIVKQFLADNAGYAVQAVDGVLTLVEKVDGPHTHKVCSGTSACADCAHAEETFEPLTDAALLSTTSGNYYLTEDLVLSEHVNPAKDLNIKLCLNGYNIKAADGAKIRFFNLNNANIQFTLCNCDAKLVSAGNNYGTVTGAVGSILFAGNKAADVQVKFYNIAFDGNTGISSSGTSTNAVIQLQNNSSLEAVGCDFTNNYSLSGGGVVRMYSTGSLKLTGCTLTGNRAKYGYALRLDKGTVVLTDTVVEGNYAYNADGANYGAVHITAEATVDFTVEGLTKIWGNSNKTTADGTGEARDLSLKNVSARQPKVKIGAKGLTDGAKIGVYLPTDRLTANPAITDALGGKNYEAYFVANNTSTEGEYKILLEEDKLVMQLTQPDEGGDEGDDDQGDTHTHKLCNNDAACVDCAHTAVTYEPWEDATKLPTSGNYYLTTNVTLSAQTAVDASTLNLCLNGHTINIASDVSTRHFMVSNNAKLTITNCDAEKEGILTGGKASSIMSKDIVNDACTIELYNVVLKGNSYSNGGAIMLQRNASLTAVSCKFIENTATSSGGAIRFYGPGRQTLINCQIKNNTAPTMSAVRQDNGHVTLIDTVIEGNVATKSGDATYGAYYLVNTNGRSLTVAGSTRITGNSDQNGKPVNLFFQNTVGNQGRVTIGEAGLSGNALIGITLQAARLTAADGLVVSTKLSGVDPTAYFVDDSEVYEVKVVDDVLTFVKEEIIVHKHNVCGDTACTDHAEVDYQAWDSATSLPTSGNYFLTTDVTLSAQTKLTGTELNLCLNGHTITVKDGSATRHFYLEQSAKLTLTNCDAENEGILTGGEKSAVMTANSTACSIELYNIVLQGNEYQSGGGGALMVQAESNAKLVNCKLLNNSATGTGGAIRHYGSGTVTLIGCEVKGNTAKTAGAIRLENGKGKLELIDTVIEGNSTTTDDAVSYGAVYAPDNTYSITVAGQTRITGNTDKNGAPANLYMAYNSKNFVLTVAEQGLTGNAKIEVFMDESRLIQNGNAITGTLGGKDYSQFFASNVENFTVALADDAIILEDHNDYGHTHKLCNDDKCSDHGSIAFKPWKETTKLPTAAGNYFLTADVTLKAVSLPADGVNLCLNGYTITAAANERSFAISTGNTLSVTDCTGNGKITGGVRNFGGVINVNGGATFNLFGGNLTGNKTVAMTNDNGKAGAVYLTKEAIGYKVGEEILTEKPADGIAYEEVVTVPGGVFNMYGGTISENTAYKGGAIYMCNGSVFNLYGGSITKNATLERGGAICTDDYATINIYGGAISENTGSKGGAIYVRGGCALNMYGGEISGNTSAKTTYEGAQVGNNTNAGAISLSNGAVMTMTGGVIKNNVSGGAGGAILMESKNTTLILKGGKITGNKSNSSDGGAIYVSTNTVFEMHGGEISGNQAKNGGGIYFLRSTGTITGGSITGNVVTTGAGGGIGMARATVTMKGGSVSYNVNKKESNPKAAGIQMNGATFNMYGGSIVGNYTVAKGSGTAITTSTSSDTTNGVKTTYYTTINMYGGTIADHEGSYGGAVLLQSKTVFNMFGGTFKNNSARTEGGAVCLYSSSVFNMSGGTMVGNSAESRGGGVKFNAGTSGTFTGGSATGNYAGQYGGFFNAHGIDTKIVMKDMKIYGNECKGYGGGIAVTWNAILDMENCEFYENVAGEGGAMNLAHKTTCNLTNVQIHDNYSKDAGGGLYLGEGNALYFTNVQITNNEAAKNGGAIYTKANVTFKDCLIDGNVSGKDGGGIATSAAWTYGNLPENTNGYVGRGQGMILENTVISNNTCVGRGGGAFMAKKNWNKIVDCTITGNVSGETGSALFVGDDLEVHGMTVTGNTSKTDGYAVYYRENSYDGQSYIQAIHSMGGNVIVKDNEGGDMMLCEKVVLSNVAEGYGEDTYINVTLSDGLLTNRIIGEYNYEGGDLNYVLTYGTRSWDEPEVVVPAEEETQPEDNTQGTEPAVTEAGEDNTMLYLAIGAIAAVIVIAAVILVVVKKKSGSKSAGKN